MRNFTVFFFLSTEMFRYQADSFILCAWQSELGAYWKPQLVYALKLRCCIDKKVAKMQILSEKIALNSSEKKKMLLLLMHCFLLTEQMLVLCISCISSFDVCLSVIRFFFFVWSL